MDGKHRAALRELCTRGRLGTGNILVADTELFDLLADSERAERYRNGLDRIEVLIVNMFSCGHPECGGGVCLRALREVRALKEPTDATERK